VPRGLVSFLIGESLEVVSFATVMVGRTASVGFLRLATLFLAQALDLATFGVMVARHGVAAEANPIVTDLVGSLGMPAVIVAKLALVLLIASLSVAASSRGGRGVWSMVGGLPLALAIAAGLIGGITNTAAILR
jgi:hypothetical protein